MIFVLGIVFMQINKNPKPVVEELSEPWCGYGSSVPHYLETDSVNMTIGKTLFLNLCASCHNKDMKSDLTGPALGGAIERWKNDTTQILKYLNDPEVYIDTTKNQQLLKVDKKFGKSVQPKFPDLTLNEVKSLIFYIEYSGF